MWLSIQRGWLPSNFQFTSFHKISLLPKQDFYHKLLPSRNILGQNPRNHCKKTAQFKSQAPQNTATSLSPSILSWQSAPVHTIVLTVYTLVSDKRDQPATPELRLAARVEQLKNCTCSLGSTVFSLTDRRMILTRTRVRSVTCIHVLESRDTIYLG